jgi:hypothetical protein
VTSSNEVTPDTFSTAMSSTDALEALKRQIETSTSPGPDRLPKTRQGPRIVPASEQGSSQQSAPLPPVHRPPARSAGRAGQEMQTPVTHANAGRYPASVPASIYEALSSDCERTGISMTTRTLAALNAQERTLASRFPQRAALPKSGSIPIRETVRRRKHLTEPAMTLTLYLDPMQRDAVNAMISQVNAGSRSELVTEALRLDLGV